LVGGSLALRASSTSVSPIPVDRIGVAANVLKNVLAEPKPKPKTRKRKRGG